MLFRRRLLALLTMLSMFRVSAAAGEVACAAAADGHESPVAPTNSQHGSMAMHVGADAHGMTMTAGAEVASPDDAAPEHMAQQPCCDAMASCGNTAVPGDRHIASSLAGQSQRVGERRGDIVASFASAPEPPPPKA